MLFIPYYFPLKKKTIQKYLFIFLHFMEIYMQTPIANGTMMTVTCETCPKSLNYSALCIKTTNKILLMELNNKAVVCVCSITTIIIFYICTTSICCTLIILYCKCAMWMVYVFFFFVLCVKLSFVCTTLGM